MDKVYLNPPLNEAVFEIRFPAELAIECRKDSFYEEVRKVFPNILVPIIDSPEPYPLKRYELRTPDQRRLIKFSINAFSFHDLEYKKFRNFKTQVLKYMKLFCSTFKISALKRTGLRYINYIPALREEGAVPISHYLRFGHSIPAWIDQGKLQEINTRFSVGLGRGILTIMIRYQEISEPQPSERLVLDFDYYREKNLTVDHLSDYLVDSHKYVKRAFEDLISDDYRGMMQEVQ